MATVNDRESGKTARKCKGSCCDSPCCPGGSDGFSGGAMPFVANGIAPPLPVSEHIGLPRPNTIFQFFIFHSSLFTFILPPSGMGARSRRDEKHHNRHCAYHSYAPGSVSYSSRKVFERGRGGRPFFKKASPTKREPPAKKRKKGLLQMRKRIHNSPFSFVLALFPADGCVAAHGFVGAVVADRRVAAGLQRPRLCVSVGHARGNVCDRLAQLVKQRFPFLRRAQARL